MLSAKDKPVIVINIDFIQILGETFEDDFGIFYFQKLRIFLNKTNRSELAVKGCVQKKCWLFKYKRRDKIFVTLVM